MIKRYSRKELTDIWSEENKYKIWLDVEVAAAQAMEKLGQIPKGVSLVVRKKTKINVKRIHQIESLVKHDVIAFLTSITEKAGIKARYLHQGMTSSDVLDTSYNIQLVQSGKVILKDLDEILKVLDRFENFHWLGSLSYPEKVRDYLSELDIYAIITGMDTTPLSLKEAQLMENPVIATNVGGNSEIMIDGETGYLVEEGNSKEIITKITILVDNKELAIKMGKEGRKFIEKEFSLDASVKNFLKIVKPYVN